MFIKAEIGSGWIELGYGIDKTSRYHSHNIILCYMHLRYNPVKLSKVDLFNFFHKNEHTNCFLPTVLINYVFMYQGFHDDIFSNSVSMQRRILFQIVPDPTQFTCKLRERVTILLNVLYITSRPRSLLLVRIKSCGRKLAL